MFNKIKDWFVDAVSNGGAIVVLVAVLIVGGVAETVQPVSVVREFINPSASAPASPLDPTLISIAQDNANLDGWKCPDNGWKRVQNGGGTLGPGYITCEKSGIVIRHFIARPNTIMEPDTAMDTNVYPFASITVEEAVNRVR